MSFGDLREARTWTRRQNQWLAVMWVVGIAIIVGIVAESYWAHTGIYKIPDIRVEQVLSVHAPCSAEHFWGHTMTYKRLNETCLRSGTVCRDFKAERWISSDNPIDVSIKC